MTKATKSSLFGSKDDKRAQAQKMKREEQAKAAAEERKKSKAENPSSFKLFVDDWESRIGSSSSMHSKPADALQGRTSLSSNPEHQPSSSSSSSSSTASLKVPVADEVYEMGDIEALARLQVKEFPAISNKPIMPQIETAKVDKERRPGGIEVIELGSPVELDRLTEFPQSSKKAERKRKKRFNRKEKTKHVTLAKVPPKGVTILPPVEKANGDKQGRPDALRSLNSITLLSLIDLRSGRSRRS